MFTGWSISWRTWVGSTLTWDVPPSCPAVHPVLPISHQPRQNQVRQEMGHPVPCLPVLLVAVADTGTRGACGGAAGAAVEGPAVGAAFTTGCCCSCCCCCCCCCCCGVAGSGWYEDNCWTCCCQGTERLCIWFWFTQACTACSAAPLPSCCHCCGMCH